MRETKFFETRPKRIHRNGRRIGLLPPKPMVEIGVLEVDEQTTFHCFILHPTKSRFKIGRFRVGLISSATGGSVDQYAMRSVLWWAYTSECEPANQTSLARCASVSLFVGPLPPRIYSGRNLMRRSSKARACRNQHTCSIPFVVSGRFVPRRIPIEETVSL